MQEFHDGAKELGEIETALKREGLKGRQLIWSMNILKQLQTMRYEYRTPLMPYIAVDKTHQIRPENGDYEGHIPQCSVARCGFECCDVGISGINTIKIAHGELENTNLSTSHLQVIESLNGAGCRVTCNNGCNGARGCGPDAGRNNAPGYKPIDCDDYPWFRNLSFSKIDFWVSDSKCPLPAIAKLTHLPGVFEHFKKQLETNPVLIESYENAIQKMVNYKEFDPVDLEKLGPDELNKIFNTGIRVALEREMQNISALTDDSPESNITAYESELRKKVKQAMEIVFKNDGLHYTHLQY